ncbi:MAG TPA: fibronectin type III domain-containing protein, partial [Acidimicrobiales bacterium]|nr:fibronectin type III domain-containing protein [Acidimicrobiales bacterium]
SPGTTPVPANANYIGNTEDRPNPGNPTDPDALLTSVTCLTSAECVEGGYYDDLEVSEVEYGCPSGCTNSMIVGETADQPQDPQASPGDGSVTVSWEAPDTDGGEAIAGYDVYEGTTSGGEGTTPVNGTLISSDTFSYQVSDLTNGDAYYFTVEAVNAVGSSPPSSEVSATPGESTTTSTSASTTTSTTATTTSTTSTSTTPSSTSTTSTTTTSTTTTSTTTTSTLASGGGPPQSIKGVVAPPLAPTAISATAGDGNVVVQWSAPLGGPSITGYDVYGGTSPGGESSMPVNGAPLSPATTTYTVSGLENGTRYYFVVQALAAGASSPHSNEVSATPTSLGALLEPGTVFVSDFSGRVIEIAPDGPEASVGSGLDLPAGLAIDAKGDLYVADEKNDRVVRLAFVAAPAGATGATGAAGGSDAAGAPTQSVAAPDLCNATICVLDPVGVAVDAAGDLFVADTGNDDVLEYPVAGGGPRRVDGHGLTGTGRSLSAPAAVAANASGQLYVADTGDGTVVRVNLADDLVTTVVSGLDEPDGIAVDTEGNVWIADSGSGELLELTPGGTLRTAARGLDAPDAVAVDSDDDVYVAEDDGVFELNPVSGAKRAIGTGLDQPVGLAVYPPAVPAAASPPLHAAVSARAASDHAASTHGASARAASPHATSPHAAAPDRRRLRRRSES